MCVSEPIDCSVVICETNTAECTWMSPVSTVLGYSMENNKRNKQKETPTQTSVSKELTV